MSAAAAIAWGLALALFAVSLWLRRFRRVRGRSAAGTASPVRPFADGSAKPSEALVFIEADGSARELTETEKRYVDNEFSPFDGARPYIKARYDQRNGWGELGGYLHRKEVPDAVAVGPAPPDIPSPQRTPRTSADSILELIRKHRPDAVSKIRFEPPRSPD
jgi:hypothetical protein